MPTLIFSCLLWVLSALPAGATTYYVANSGNNGNSCSTAQSSTASNAKATITQGLTCLALGATLRIQAGPYTDTIFTDLAGQTIVAGTSWTNPTTIESYAVKAITEL
jgi:hypothetical protein